MESERDAHTGNHVAQAPSETPLIFDMESLAKAGLRLIPLAPKSKKPRDARWQLRDYDNASVLQAARKSGSNVGVRLTSDWLVIDVDPRNFQAGCDPLNALAEKVGLDLSKCPRVNTGSGGQHYYLRKPADVSVLDSIDGYDGVEFKSAGRQVVAPGSIHPNGTRYEWDDFAPFVSEAPSAPAALLELVHRPARLGGATADGAGELSPEKLAETLEQLDAADFKDHEEWFKLMTACHHATAGEGREEFIEWSSGDPEYAADSHIIGRRWDSLHTDTGNRQPITIKYLHKVMQEHGGYVAPPNPEDEFEAWEEGGGAQPKQRWRFLSVEELEALPPPTWLVPGVLTEGSLAAIYGPPESFKSFLALDMALSIAANVAWHSRPVSEGGVLYVAGEGASGLGKRVRAWRTEHRTADRRVTFKLMRDDINFAAEKDSDVRAFVDAVSGQLGSLKLVVIDTLNQTAAGADENSAKDMSRYIASMKRLRDETGAAVLVVHHSGKDASKGMRGSTALLGAMDTTIEVERVGDGRSVAVNVRKQKDAERGSPMRFSLEQVGDSLVLRATVTEDPSADFLPDDNPMLDLACNMARQRGGRLPLKDFIPVIMERDGCKDRTARRKIEHAIPEGRVAALKASDGSSLWMERVDNNPRGELVIRAEVDGA